MESIEYPKFYFKVVFYPETAKEEIVDFKCEFMKEVAKAKLSVGLPFYEKNDVWIVPVNRWIVKSMPPCAECLWSMYVYTSNTAFPEVKEITFVDDVGVQYKNPIPFYPCRGMAVS